MEVIRSRDVISIIRKALGLVDVRLIDHGERVSYIMYKIMQTENKLSKAEIRNICVMGLFHDIGAYKTDEINNMVAFETKNTWNHAIYGYLFIKNMTPFYEMADSVLFHHINYKNFDKVECENVEAAQLIKLADRVDIFLNLQGGILNTQMIIRNKGIMFSPKLVDLFFEADKKYNLLDNIKSGEYIEELYQLFDEMNFSDYEIDKCLQMLAYSIDFRSEVTVKHTVTTVRISMEIAKVLKLQVEDLYYIYYGSLLHDLGKIAIPVEILEDTGRLNDKDMTIMKTHVVITEDIISEYINSTICNIAVRHHEKLDGSGYPRGLLGKFITLNERIVAVGDIVSALSGTRSYKKPFDKKTIVDILTKMSRENKLCSNIIQVYLDNYDMITQNVNESSNDILETYNSIKVEYSYLLNKFDEICL